MTGQSLSHGRGRFLTALVVLCASGIVRPAAGADPIEIPQLRSAGDEAIAVLLREAPEGEGQ